MHHGESRRHMTLHFFLPLLTVTRMEQAQERRAKKKSCRQLPHLSPSDLWRGTPRLP